MKCRLPECYGGKKHKGRVVLDMQSIRERIDDLHQEHIDAEGTSLDPEFVKDYNELIDKYNADIGKCRNSASDVKSVVQTEDGRFVEVSDIELEQFKRNQQ